MCLVELRQLRRAAAKTVLGCSDHHALTRQMLRKGFAPRPFAGERRDRLRPDCRSLRRQFVLGSRDLRVFQLQLHLLQQPCRAFRAAAIEFAPQLLDLSFKWAISACVPELSACARAAATSVSTRAARSTRIIACAAARSDGNDSGAAFTTAMESISAAVRKPKSSSHRCRPPTLLRMAPIDPPTRDNRAEPERSSPRRSPERLIIPAESGPSPSCPIGTAGRIKIVLMGGSRVIAVSMRRRPASARRSVNGRISSARELRRLDAAVHRHGLAPSYSSRDAPMSGRRAGPCAICVGVRNNS